MISWSILSPAIRIEWLSTMPPREITATSVVPPPMSTIMQPEGSMIGRAGPLAAPPGAPTREGAPGAARGGGPGPARPPLFRDAVDGDDAGLVDDDAAALHHHEGVGGAEVYSHVVREQAKERAYWIEGHAVLAFA